MAAMAAMAAPASMPKETIDRTSSAGPQQQKQQKKLLLLLFVSAAAVRVLLAAAFPALPDLLSGRVEISTPVTSFKRMQEGVFLYNHGMSPYDGGVFHQAPLLLPLFSLLPNPTEWPLVTVLLYTVLDLISADALVKIAQSGEAYSSRLFKSTRKDQSWTPIAVAASYLFNPLTLLTCLGRPTSVFSSTFVLVAISHAIAAKPTTALLALALATHVSLHPILLLPPVILLAHDALLRKSTQARPALAAFTTRLCATFTLSLALVSGLSYLITGCSWAFMSAVYNTRLLLPDLSPNVGLWWYFFIEIFDSFRAFFLAVFWLHLASYTPGLTLRLRTQPLAVCVLLVGVAAIFQPYASVGDAGLWISMLTLYAHVFELTRYAFPALSALLYSALLGPAFHYLWIYAGSGNANFFYAITLVWSLALSIVLADVLYAILRDEWELRRPDMKGKDVRQI